MSAAALSGEQFLFIDEYTVAEIAAFVHKNTSTVKQWFRDMPGVFRYPRGKGNQQESLGITPPAMWALLRRIGHVDADIEERLVKPHRQRLEAEQKRVQASTNGTSAVRRKPPTKAKPPEPAPKKSAGGRRR